MPMAEEPPLKAYIPIYPIQKAKKLTLTLIGEAPELHYNAEGGGMCYYDIYLIAHSGKICPCVLIIGGAWDLIRPVGFTQSAR